MGAVLALVLKAVDQFGDGTIALGRVGDIAEKIDLVLGAVGNRRVALGDLHGDKCLVGAGWRFVSCKPDRAELSPTQLGKHLVATVQYITFVDGEVSTFTVAAAVLLVFVVPRADERTKESFRRSRAARRGRGRLLHRGGLIGIVCHGAADKHWLWSKIAWGSWRGDGAEVRRLANIAWT